MSAPPPDLALSPDLARARRFVEARGVPGRVLQVAVVGAHAYGFPSPDSDVDLKGAFLAPTESLLGLEEREATVDLIEDFEGLEHDLTLHEVKMALRLLLRGNGNLLERFLSPLQLYPGAATEELAELARGAASSRFYGHYRGYFGGMCREHQGAEVPRVKSLLYAYRVALTGVHLLRTGECVMDLGQLAEPYGFGEALELIARKAAGEEKGSLPAEEDRRHRARWPDLERALEEAKEETPLPAEAPNRAAIDAWLRRARLADLRT